MPEHKTSNDRVVPHLHREPDLHAADQELARRFMNELFPRAEVVKEATLKYNCHGFALAPAHEGWYNTPDFFLSDDFTGTADAPQPGDVLIYGQNGIITHSAVVVEISNGAIEMLQSKWGGVAEVKHPVDHVPGVYGEPIVLLRRRPGVPQHPAVSGVVDAAATVGETSGEASADDAPEPQAEATEVGTAETMSAGKQAPERFMLMLASTPEVERHIRQSLESTQGGGAASFTRPPINNSSAAPPFIDNSGAAAETLDTASTLETFPAEDTQDDIQKALVELSAPVTQFQLMLASTPEVLREAASRLQPIQDLIELDKTKPETRKTIVEFFEKPETQADEEITGLTLFLLMMLPSKEAVVALARYLEAGKFSPFNGSLAVDALKAAVAGVTT